MASNKSRIMGKSRFWVAVFSSVLLISSCEIYANIEMESSNLIASAKSDGSNSKVAQREASAGLAQGDPTKDDVAFLIVLGQVQAAIRRANHHDKENAMKNPFTP